MKKQIALLLSATFALSSFGFSAWAEEVEVSEPILGGVEIVPPSIADVEDVEIITPDFVVDGEVIEIPEEDFEIEETVNDDTVEIEDDFSDIDLPEVGASSMLSGSGSEVIMGEEIQNAPANTTFDMLVNFDTPNNNSIAPLERGGSRTNTVAYSYDSTLGSNVGSVTKANPGETGSMMFLKYPVAEGKKGVIETGIKFKNTEINSLFSPISFGTNGTWNTDTSLFATVYVTNGYFRVAGNSANIAPVEANQWYEVKITYDIDGKTTTANTFSYKLYKITSNGNVLLGEGTNCPMTQQLIVKTGTYYSSAATIKDFTFLAYGKGYNGAATNPEGTVSFDDAYVKYIEPTIKSSTIPNGSTGKSPVEAFEIAFDQYMDETTYSNITVEKLDKTLDTPAFVSVTGFQVGGDSKRATLAFNEMLEGNTTYKITLPSSVKAWCGKSIAAPNNVIQFTTGVYVYQPPFDPSVSFERKFDDNSTSSLSFFCTARNIVTDTDLNSNVLEINRTGGADPTSPGSYCSNLYYNLSSPLNGSIFMSVKFKLKNNMLWDFAPITLSTSVQTPYYTSAAFLNVRDGKFLENDCKTSPADAETDVWYQFDVTLFVDGDKTTVDSYSYTLKRLDGGYLVDDKKEVTKENVTFGTHEHGASGAGYKELVEVKKINFGQICTFRHKYPKDSEYNVSDKYYIDDIVVKKFLAPDPTVNIANGAVNVPINKEIKLTFDQKVDASAFSKIMLKQGENVIDVTPSVTSGLVKSVTLDTKDFDYNREYVLTISGIKNEGGIQALTKNITFSTELKPSSVGIDSATVTKTTNGNAITIAATLENKAMPAKTQASIIATLVGETTGRVYDIAYKTYAMEAQSTSTSLELTKPNNLSEAVKVIVYAFDTINNMDLAANPIDK